MSKDRKGMSKYHVNTFDELFQARLLNKMTEM